MSAGKLNEVADKNSNREHDRVPGGITGTYGTAATTEYLTYKLWLFVATPPLLQCAHWVVYRS